MGGRLEAVPEEEARMDWLRSHWTGPPSEAARKGLAKWYGEAEAQEVRHAESFQIAEYGRQPTLTETRQLFRCSPNSAAEKRPRILLHGDSRPHHPHPPNCLLSEMPSP